MVAHINSGKTFKFHLRFSEAEARSDPEQVSPACLAK